MTEFVNVPEIDEWLRTHSFPPQEHGKVSTSYWRESAHQIIGEVLRATEGQEPDERLAAIDAAYPFGPRKHWPYRQWLRERRAAMVDLGLVKHGKAPQAR